MYWLQDLQAPYSESSLRTALSAALNLGDDEHLNHMLLKIRKRRTVVVNELSQLELSSRLKSAGASSHYTCLCRWLVFFHGWFIGDFPWFWSIEAQAWCVVIVILLLKILKRRAVIVYKLSEVAAISDVFFRLQNLLFVLNYLHDENVAKLCCGMTWMQVEFMRWFSTAVRLESGSLFEFALNWHNLRRFYMCMTINSIRSLNNAGLANISILASSSVKTVRLWVSRCPDAERRANEMIRHFRRHEGTWLEWLGQYNLWRSVSIKSITVICDRVEVTSSDLYP